jgi:hypothetical protein
VEHVLPNPGMHLLHPVLFVVHSSLTIRKLIQFSRSRLHSYLRLRIFLCLCTCMLTRHGASQYKMLLSTEEKVKLSVMSNYAPRSSDVWSSGGTAPRALIIGKG